MKPILSSGLSPAHFVTSSLLLAASANAAFTWNETGAMTYDGTGVDAGINPFAQATDPNGDVSIANTAGSTASLTVQSGTLTINTNTVWADKVGHGPSTTQNAQGAITVENGASLSFLIDDDNEDRLMFGNGYNASNGGKRGIATVTLNGGTLTCVDDPANTLAYTHADRQVRFGSDGGVANVALNAGEFIISSSLPVAFGDRWTTNGTVFTAFATSPSVSTMTITNGSFKITNGANGGTATVFGVGANDRIDFIGGGTGKLSFLGWSQAQFEALVTAGRITKNGGTATAAEFNYTLNGSQGEYRLDNTTLLAPSVASQPSAAGGFVGGGASFTAAISGNPTPTLLWEVSTDSGASWSSTGVTTSTLSLTGLTYPMNGRLYQLKATNSQGTTTSNAVGLTVAYPNPAISAQPVSVDNATAGVSSSLSVTASGIGALAYQWQKSVDGGSTWVDVSGATAATLTFNPVAHADAGLYHCVVTDPAATADSLPATTATSNWAYLSLANTSTGFVWTPANGTMTYDGAGADSGINPFTQVGNDIAVGLNTGNTANLTVNSGALTVLNKDQWSPKIGRSGGIAVVTINTGATFNLIDTGAGSAANSEQRIQIGSNNANGTINVNGGNVTMAVGPGADTARGLTIGTGNNAAFAGTLNLNTGTFTYPSDAGVNLGSEAAAGVINIKDGHFVASGTSSLVTGSNDYLTFETGKNGTVSILGWGSADTDNGIWNDYGRFRTLVLSGKVKLDGAVVFDDSRFSFSDSGSLGVMKVNNTNVFAPIVNLDPSNQEAMVGGSATFTASVSANPVPSLQWQRSENGGVTWQNVAGANGASHTVTNITYAMHDDAYRVVANNPLGSTETFSAYLSVSYGNPVVNAQPVSLGGVAAGSGASFAVTASGVGSLTYQWEKSTDAGNTWTAVSGATAATLSLDPVAHVDAGLFRCVVTDPAALADSLPATSTASNWACLSLANTSTGFVWEPVNSTMTYDGAGVDSAINPYTQVGNDIAIGFGNGSSSSLTLSSGTLTILNVDQWSAKIGQNHTNGHTGTGVVTVNAGATLNLGDTGSGGSGPNSQQAVVIGARANASLHVNGGTVNIHIGPGTDGGRGFQIGGSGEAGYTGTLNLNAGTLNYPSDAPIRIGTGAGVGMVNVGNGHLRATATTTVLFGANDFINFTTGGTGSVAILGWDSATDPDHTLFKGLVDAGRIQINGVVATAGDYAPFLFSDDSGLGVMKINPSHVASPYLAWAKANAGGQGAELDHDGDGMKNGIEFFLNAAAGFTANPKVIGGSVTWPNGGNIASGAYGTQFKVQTSGNLSTWDDVLAADPNLSNTAASVSYALPAGAGKLFMRLVVTPN